MRKRILCLAMMVLLVTGIPMTALADDYQGKEGWQAEFKDDKLSTNFASGQLLDDQQLQPGDSIDLKVNVKNSGNVDTDWYMTNEVIQTLEDAAKNASDGAYEYRLAFVDSSDKETVLFDSATVGASGTEGLKQIGGMLENYVYLARLEQGQSGTVHLRVKLEGETQGNGYQQTLAKLQLNFAVEKVVSGGTSTGGNVIKNPVKTGDHTQLVWLCTVLLVSGLVLLLLGVIVIRRRRRDDDEEGV